LVVYVDQPLLDPMVTPSLVPAAGEGSTNGWLCEAKDRSIWRFQEALDVPGFDRFDADLADPTQVAWDLQRLGGEDRGEALEQVVEWILRR